MKLLKAIFKSLLSGDELFSIYHLFNVKPNANWCESPRRNIVHVNARQNYFFAAPVKCKIYIYIKKLYT